MKKFIALILCLMIMLTGCVKSAKNISLRLMIYAIGIDRDESGYTVSYQVFSPTGENISSPVNADETNVKVISVTGDTIYECEQLAELQSGRELFTQDAEAIVLGNGIGEGDIYEILGYFEGSPDVYMGTDVICASGSAKEAVGVGISGLSDPHGFGEMIDEAIAQATAISPRLAQISNRIVSSGSFILPIMKIAYDDDGNPYAEGVFDGVLYANGEYSGVVDSDTVKGIRLLDGTAKTVPISFELTGEAVGAECRALKIKRRVYISESGTAVISVEIKGELEPYDIRKKSNAESLVTSAENEIKRLCNQALETALQYNADLFDASLLFGKHGYEYKGMDAVQFEVKIALQLH